MAIDNAINDTLSDQFDPFRNRLKQQAARQRSQEEKQVKRQFARTGQTGSGAFVKTLQEAGRREGAAIQEGEFQIGAQEAQERRRLKEIEAGKEFAASESQKGREFAKGESALGRRFAQDEAKIGRDFAASQSDFDRKFQAGEAKLLRDFTKGLEDQKLALEKEIFENTQLTDQQKISLQQQQLDYDKVVGNFNMQLAKWEQDQPTDIVSGLLGTDISDIGFGGDTGNVLSGAASGAAVGAIAGSIIPGAGTAAGAAVGGVIGGSLALFCFVADTMVKMRDESFKKIQEIELGDELYLGSIVNCIAKAYADDDLYEIDGEICTATHSIADEDLEFKFVSDIERSVLTDLPQKTIVYPLNTDTGFYVTKSGNVSLAYMEVEGAITPEDELYLINRDGLLIDILKKSNDDRG